MEATRIDEARAYEARGHHGVGTVRLQGGEQSDTEHLVVGLSRFEPGGGADESSSDAERVYVVLDGQVTVTSSDRSVTLGRLDSCLIRAGESRSVLNDGSGEAVMLVIVARSSATHGSGA